MANQLPAKSGMRDKKNIVRSLIFLANRGNVTKTLSDLEKIYGGKYACSSSAFYKFLNKNELQKILDDIYEIKPNIPAKVNEIDASRSNMSLDELKKEVSGYQIEIYRNAINQIKDDPTKDEQTKRQKMNLLLEEMHMIEWQKDPSYNDNYKNLKFLENREQTALKEQYSQMKLKQFGEHILRALMEFVIRYAPEFKPIFYNNFDEFMKILDDQSKQYSEVI